MLVQDVLKKTTEFFQSKKLSSPRLDAELILAEALGWKRLDLYLKFDYPMTEEEVSRSREFVRRRAQGEPVSYITSTKEFYRNSFKVGPGVLIPRPETEELVEMAAEFLKQQSSTVNVLDIGAGSGCIGLSLAKEFSHHNFHLVEKSSEAFEFTKKNCQNLGVQANTEITNADIENVNLSDKQFDLVLANPPYIDRSDTEVSGDVVSSEPHEALFAGDNGMEFIKKWATRAAEWMKPGAKLIFEIGYKQGQDAANFVRSLPFAEVQVRKDYSGRDRFLVALKEGVENG